MTRLPDLREPLRRADRIRLSWSESLVGTASGLRMVALFGFLESTVLPAPLEAITVPLMLHRPGRAYRVAAALWIGLILGALSFYLLGRALYEPAVGPILDMLDLQRDFERLADRLTGQHLFWVLFLASLAPTPLQLATLGAGFVKADPVVFLTAVAAARAIRYFGVAWLCRVFGTRFGLLRGGTALQYAALALALVVIWLILRRLA